MLAALAGADGRPKARTLLSKGADGRRRSSWRAARAPGCPARRARGRARRRADTVKDLDIVAASSDPEALAAFCELEAIDTCRPRGPPAPRS